MSELAEPLTARVSNSRIRNLVELWVGYGLILIVIWTPGNWKSPFFIASVLWIGLISWRSFRGWDAMGLRSTNLLRSLWIAGVALLIATIAVVLAIRLGTLHVLPTLGGFVRRFWKYGLGALVQQFLLQDFCLERFRRLEKTKGIAVFGATLLFSVAHLPNPILTPLTFIWGWAACLLFLHYRNLYSLGIAHAFFGIAIAICIPSSLTHGLRVGLEYLTYH